MAGLFSPGRLRELISKYGKVAVAVHFSVSGVSIAGFYLAIKNNVDVEGVLQRVGLSRPHEQLPEASARERTLDIHLDDVEKGGNMTDPQQTGEQERRKPSADVLISGGGAFALAIICNKALLPVRVPLTFALTPPIARFLARRNLYKAGH